MILLTGVALVTSSVLIGFAFSKGSDGTNSFFGFLSSSSSVGTAEAAILPLDVKQTFRSMELSGDGKVKPSAMKIDSEFIDPDEHCEFCYRIEFTPGATGKAGAMLKSDKSLNLKDAMRLTLYARGESGGEDVKFIAAGKYVDGDRGAGAAKLLKYGFDSENMKLKKDWQKYEIDLSNADLNDITHAFGFEIGKANLKNSAQPIVIYLKGIAFDDIPADKAVRASNSTAN